MNGELQEFARFLDENADAIIAPGGCQGLVLAHPEFDLFPRDFLHFAKESLHRRTPSAPVNCVSQLKRATECQIDCLLHVMGLLGHFRKCNLGLERKLDFLNQFGVYSGRSLERLSNLRNKLEHEYKLPEVADLQLYFDLVSGFINAMEAFVVLFSAFDDIEVILEQDSENSEKSFFYSLDRERQVVRVKWPKEDQYATIERGLEQYEDFAFLLRTAWLVLRLRKCLSVSDFRQLVSTLKGS